MILADTSPLLWPLIGLLWALVFWAFMGVVIWSVRNWPRRGGYTGSPPTKGIPRPTSPGEPRR